MPPAGVAIGTAVAASAASAAVTSTVVVAGVTISVGTLAAVAITAAGTALQYALAPGAPDAGRPAGIRTEGTLTGGAHAESFVLGTYATDGALIAPPMTHGSDEGTPNAYLVYVVEIGSAPGHAVEGLFIDDEEAPIGASVDGPRGRPIGGRWTVDGEPYAWLKTYDGTQTSASAYLLNKHGNDDERPWTADMIGAGISYAVVTFRYDREVFPQFPRVRFVVSGLALYDISKDSTAGGSGSHRWGNPSTWEQTQNPAVMIYNILRGITLPGGDIWGGGVAGDDLPAADWIAAIQHCDEQVAKGGGGTEPRYRAGYEVMLDDEPAAVIEQLLKACSGQLVESGGVWRPRVGPVGSPVLTITDDDIVATEPQQLDPWPSQADARNGVRATFPAQAGLWEPREAPPRFDAAAEAEDGRRLVADLDLPAVPYGRQVQRLMRAYLRDERRFRRHVLTLPPDAGAVEPLDAIAWTSARNGYQAKIFEVAQTSHDLRTGLVRVVVRERNPNDYDWTANDELADAPASAGRARPALSVTGWDVTAATVKDGAGSPRRPALKLSWSAAGVSGRALRWQIRVQDTGEIVARGSTPDLDDGELLVAEGILPGVTYEARARLRHPGRETTWTDWTTAPVAQTRFKRQDIDDDATDVIGSDQQISAVTATDSWTKVASIDIDRTEPGPVIVQFSLEWTVGSQIEIEAREDSTTINGTYRDLDGPGHYTGVGIRIARPTAGVTNFGIWARAPSGTTRNVRNIQFVAHRFARND